MERLTLAEAIRRGSAGSTKSIGAFYRGNGDGMVSMCALGAAADACSILPVDLATWFPELAIETIVCPVCLQVDTLWTTITALNDHHNWTRQAIADWIDSMTLDLAPVAAPIELAV